MPVASSLRTALSHPSSVTYSHHAELREGSSYAPGHCLHPAEGSVLPEDQREGCVKSLFFAPGTLRVP